jgi:hypothetical protein
VKTGSGFVYQGIRPEFIVPHPATLISLGSDYCFYNDLPAGAWLDAPDTLAAGSHCNHRGFPTPSVAWRL